MTFCAIIIGGMVTGVEPSWLVLIGAWLWDVAMLASWREKRIGKVS